MQIAKIPTPTGVPGENTGVAALQQLPGATELELDDGALEDGTLDEGALDDGTLDDGLELEDDGFELDDEGFELLDELGFELEEELGLDELDELVVEQQQGIPVMNRFLLKSMYQQLHCNRLGS